jgi:hypothetical protein
MIPIPTFPEKYAHLLFDIHSPPQKVDCPPVEDATETQ